MKICIIICVCVSLLTACSKEYKQRTSDNIIFDSTETEELKGVKPVVLPGDICDNTSFVCSFQINPEKFTKRIVFTRCLSKLSKDEIYGWSVDYDPKIKNLKWVIYNGTKKQRYQFNTIVTNISQVVLSKEENDAEIKINSKTVNTKKIQLDYKLNKPKLEVNDTEGISDFKLLAF